MTKPIIVWITPPGPNPWKVILLLEELGTPYEIKAIHFQDVKQKPYIDINPNGRVPAIQDPNTDVTLWETGAIILYLIEQYDTSRTLTCDTLKEKNQLHQWLMFQVSGQGPYFGQCAWFNSYHPEKLPSAIDRYSAELKRILGVLESHLSGNASGTTPRQWLVGDKMTYADLAFVTWNNMVDQVLAVGANCESLKEFPNVEAWHGRIVSRPAFQRCWELRTKYMVEQGLIPAKE